MSATHPHRNNGSRMYQSNLLLLLNILIGTCTYLTFTSRSQMYDLFIITSNNRIHLVQIINTDKISKFLTV